jgi:Na+-translocating ferredoxin:NAD+ oxidoreductase RnfG subunit
MKKSNIMPSVVLGAICLIVGLLLSLINSVTAPIIEEAQNAAANAALAVVLPEGKNFTEITIDDKYPASITKGYKADGGFVFQATVTGKSSGLIILCGINAEGKIVGTKVIAEQETDSYDVKVFPEVEGTEGKYKDMDLNNFEPYLVSGATLTSRAYSEAVKACLQSFEIANGGTVDTRPAEVIFAEKLNLALGTANESFTRWYQSNKTLGNSEIYLLNSGVVVVTGESFVGYSAESGEPVGEHSTETLAAANAAYSVYTAMTKVNLSDYQGISKIVKYAYKTTNGEYLFRLENKGFEWAATPIVIELMIGKDGKIVSCVTVSHSESGGYGYPCGTPEYYEQYNGKNSETYTEVPNIVADATESTGINGGATQTSNGYKNAIKAAFSAFNTLTATAEGGNE